MSPSSSEESELVILDLRRHVTGDDDGGDTVALPVAAIKSLLGVIQRTKANTMMGLQDELKQASEYMLKFAHDEKNAVLLGGRSHIALASGCELFLRYVKSSHQVPININFEQSRKSAYQFHFCL